MRAHAVSGFDQFEHAGQTDVGVRRSHNQDSFRILLASDAKRWAEQGHVFHVADGMGAHAVGEMASAMACNIIGHTFHKYSHEGVVTAIRKAFTEANASIHEKGQKNPEFAGMGTTSTALVLRPEGMWVGHVGDSRAYRVRQGVVQQLSFDHSLVWEKARRKHVRPEDLQGIPSNVIIRSLGPEATVEPDVQGPHDVQEGDIFLVCSDGLSGPLSDKEIGAVSSVLPPNEACQFLIDLANLRGGPDNISVIVVRIGGAGKAKAKSVATDGKPRKSLLERIPWPLWILLLGMILAVIATGLIAGKLPGAAPVFSVAAVVILAGIAALGVYHVQEKRRAEQDEGDDEPHTEIFRETNAKVDQGLLARLTQAQEVLIRQAREHKWEIDWKAQQKLQEQATQFQAKGNLAAAFREMCRSTRLFTAELARLRHKSEAFKPVWEKSEG